MNKFTQAAAAIIYNDAGALLIQDHVKCNFLTCPIGAVEAGESHAAAMCREMKEELGITVTKFTGVLTGDIDCGELGMIDTWVFRIDEYTGIIENREPQKHRSLTWYQEEELIKLHHSGTKLSTTLKLWLDL